MFTQGIRGRMVLTVLACACHSSTGFSALVGTSEANVFGGLTASVSSVFGGDLVNDSEELLSLGGIVQNGASVATDAGGALATSSSLGTALSTGNMVAFGFSGGTLQAVASGIGTQDTLPTTDGRADAGSLEPINGVDIRNANARAQGNVTLPNEVIVGFLYASASAFGDSLAQAVAGAEVGSAAIVVNAEGTTPAIIITNGVSDLRSSADGRTFAGFAVGITDAVALASVDVFMYTASSAGLSRHALAGGASGAYAFTVLAPGAEQPLLAPRFGDFNFSFTLDANDVDLLTSYLRDGLPNPESSVYSVTIGESYYAGANPLFDLNLDTFVDAGDVDALILHELETQYGDRNLDGSVNLLDLDGFTIGGAGWSQGDFNGDGLVDIVDLEILAQNFGFQNGGSLSVPEPTGAFGLVAGLLAATFRRSATFAVRLH